MPITYAWCRTRRTAAWHAKPCSNACICTGAERSAEAGFPSAAAAHLALNGADVALGVGAGRDVRRGGHSVPSVLARRQRGLVGAAAVRAGAGRVCSAGRQGSSSRGESTECIRGCGALSRQNEPAHGACRQEPCCTNPKPDAPSPAPPALGRTDTRCSCWGAASACPSALLCSPTAAAACSSAGCCAAGCCTCCACCEPPKSTWAKSELLGAPAICAGASAAACCCCCCVPAAVAAAAGAVAGAAAACRCGSAPSPAGVALLGTSSPAAAPRRSSSARAAQYSLPSRQYRLALLGGADPPSRPAPLRAAAAPSAAAAPAAAERDGSTPSCQST